jgi:phosphohistidine phosphatase
VIIHLLRHAKTNQVSPSGRDFDRELLPRGYEQLTEFKSILAQHSIAVTRVFCSSAKRTRQTWEEIASNFPNAELTFHDELYLASHQTLLGFLSQQQSSEELLVIGHNEGLSDLASYLSDSDIHLKTCGYIQLSFPFDHSGFVSVGTGSVVDRFRC